MLRHNTLHAKWYLNKISEVGIADTEDNEYAARYAENHEEPVLPLLRARLHADGGYYLEALQDLKPMKISDSTPKAVRAKYLYRKVRIYQGIEELQKAVAYYQKTIAICGKRDLYFAPNAALQLGYIYQKANQTAKAKVYFTRVLNYKGHPYKNSIAKKAKLALSAL